jgi:hypothetical protein
MSWGSGHCRYCSLWWRSRRATCRSAVSSVGCCWLRRSEASKQRCPAYRGTTGRSMKLTALCAW